jgi:gliding motility-associated-like protein
VKSGSNDVCVDNSAPVKLNDYPVIVNNAIKTNSVNKPICSGSAAPGLVDSLVIAGGNNTYAYSWEYRTSTLPWTPVVGVTTAAYSPGALNVTTDFRRTVVSSACSSVSNIITITAHSAILNNSISILSAGTDTTLCNGGNPSKLTGTVTTGGINSYAYLWLSSTDNATWTQIPTAGTLRDYDPPALSVTTYYKRQVISGACLVVSASTVNVNVLPLINNNTISGTLTVCKNLVPKVITGGALTGGSGSYTYLWQESSDGGSTWIPAKLINNTADYQPPALSIPMKYRRYVTSGLKNTCQNTSNIFDISIDPLPLSQIDAGQDDDIFSIQRIYQLKAVAPLTGENGVWKPLNNGTFTISDTTRNDAAAGNLSLGANLFLWTVHRGPCKLSDSVSIDVHKDLFPQGFSPNEDPYNNTFIIEGLDLDVHFVDLKIVNGAGTEVYKTSNRNGQTSISWDGKNDKGLELPEGTYYYMLNLTSKKSNASVFKKSGFIILKRY